MIQSGLKMNDPMIRHMLNQLNRISPKAERSEINQIKAIILEAVKAKNEMEIVQKYESFCSIVKKLAKKYN